MHPASQVRREPFPFRKLDQQTVIINPRSREVHVLNGTASTIWELLEHTQSVSELVALVAADFEGEPGEIHDDVFGFVGDLERKGLVVSLPTDPRG